MVRQRFAAILVILALLVIATAGCHDRREEVFAVQLTSAPDLPPPSVAQPHHAVATLRPREVKVDVNHAGLNDLERLPGVSRIDAERILAGRPYRSKRDLLRRHLLTEQQYERVKEYLIAHRAG